MKKTALVITLIIFSIFKVYSQTGEIKRISLTDDLGNGGIVNLYKLGLAINNQKGADCEFTFYDENLKKNGNCNLTFENKREFVSDYYFDSTINKILVFHNFKRINSLTLITPDTKKKKTLKLELPVKKSYLNTSFVKLEKSIYLITTTKGKTSLNTIELANGDISAVDMPIEWKARVILKMSRVNAQYAALFYLDKTIKNKKFKNVALIDDEGKVVADKLVGNDKDDFPIEEFSITDLGNEQLAIAGTYSASVNSEYSIGLFVAKIDNLKLSYIKYFEYNKIKNFYNFMSEKSKEKAEKRAEKNANKGRSTKYLAVTHPVIMVDGRFLVTAEFYYPTYRTETRTTSSGTTTTRVFDGYQYTHTIVLGINDDGKKDFEHCIPLKLDYKPFYARQKLKRRVSKEEIKYSYIAFNKIYSFSIAGDDLSENDPKTLVEVDEDKKLKSTYSFIDSWYDNYFYAKTIQTTKEKGKLIGGKETNYFLIKYGVD